jgi:hypothetical protein
MIQSFSSVSRVFLQSGLCQLASWAAPESPIANGKDLALRSCCLDERLTMFVPALTRAAVSVTGNMHHSRLSREDNQGSN